MSGDFNELKAKVYHAKDIVYLENDIKFDNRAFRNEVINIKTDNITIEGNNHSIDAMGERQIFNITGKNITLKNIVFKNGYTERYGGALRNDKGQINLINCKFINNIAENNGNDISNGPQSELFIDNCEFSQKNNKYPIWNHGCIKINSKRNDEMKNIISGGEIEFVKPSKIKTDIIINPELLSTTYPNEARYSITLNDENGEIISNQRIYLDGDILPQKTDSVGKIEGKISKTVGKYNIPIEFKGSEKYNPSKVPLKLNVKPRVDPNFPPTSAEKPYFFISYAHKDEDLIYPEIRRFQDLGCNIWYDQGISAGSIWRKDVVHHLNNSSLVIAFITPISVTRPNVIKEIFHAIDKEIPIIPIFLEDFDKIEMEEDLEFELNHIQGIEKNRYTDEEYINKFIKALENYGFEIEYSCN